MYGLPPDAQHIVFQSTPPVRGATAREQSRAAAREQSRAAAEPEISIHAPREGGDLHVFPMAPRTEISIHAPREGGDPVCV